MVSAPCRTTPRRFRRATAGPSWPISARCSSARTLPSTTCRPTRGAAIPGGRDNDRRRQPISAFPTNCASDHAAVARRASRLLGVAGLLATVAGLFVVSPNQFYRSYLWSYLFVLGLAIGSLAWLMLQYLTGGAWGVVIRRPCEAAARTMPLVALMFLPIVIGIPNLYPWAHPETVAADEVLRHKQPYLNVPFFRASARRSTSAAGGSFPGFMNRWSAREDSEGGTDAVARQDERARRARAHLLGLQRHLHGHRLGAVDRPATGSPPCSACCSWPGRGSPSMAFLIAADGAALLRAGRCRRC